MNDIIIKNGTLIDGLETKAFKADIAINGDIITAIGQDLGEARQVIDADGLLVTPGWVDIHTHYDAQATWDPYLTPSSFHGVTTTVMGNCGVGFAPVKADKRDWLIGLMEGVEDIPGAALTEGIQWEWETFPEYLEALKKRNYVMDIGTQVPHGAVRGYVMGDRGAANEPATDEDIAAMYEIVKEGLEAGALGFSTSRTLIHKAIDGRPVPGTFAEKKEVFGIGQALADVGHGVFEMASQHETLDVDIQWMDELSQKIGRPVSTNLSQIDENPNLWREVLHRMEQAPEDSQIIGQASGRAIGIVMGLDLTAHPFATCPYFLQELMHMPPEERRQKLMQKETQEKLLADTPLSLGAFEDFITKTFSRMFPFNDEPDYEPTPDMSIAALAKKNGCTPQEEALKHLLAYEGRGFLYFPLFNYAQNSLDPTYELLNHKRVRLGLSDGGAHCGAICDGSVPTFMLTFWARDRQRGPKMSLERVVAMQTSETAALFGIEDRGQLTPGYKADINIIDFDNLKLHRPEVIYDLPAGGRRLSQKASGYHTTMKSGVVTHRGGQPTGELPGQVLLGPQAAPAQA